ncbi:MAG: hypothetical protein COV72_03605 [Candidatus Omnitrophica bacterium CG11_big_fil_rev_8_21_14_0_20_42_13]|uniref:Small-conductance mechanosensitive ion channel n=1 Tax=Candidatus Ghiorseimicrobium undicola TaxID=1974746 RepID=A0A2H0LY89_9BACT|nr:MAG: hypothetical protein COV72_03605 [Candidatus Omnitrophica bacterium CG11_big_fil_rev_8_21_14_0_20_42_13]
MWKTVLFEPVSNFLSSIGELLRSGITVIFILLIGWLIAKLIQRIITKFFKLVKIDSIADQIGVNAFLSKGGIKLTIAELLGSISYWLVFLIALCMAVDAIGLTAAADLLNQVVLYIPKVIIAIIVLALGMFIATFLSAAVKTAAVNAGVSQSNLLAKIVEVVIIISAVIIALEQLQIGIGFINSLVIAFLAALSLGFGLAFGLGCKDLIGKMVSEAVDKIKKK